MVELALAHASFHEAEYFSHLQENVQSMYPAVLMGYYIPQYIISTLLFINDFYEFIKAFNRNTVLLCERLS